MTGPTVRLFGPVRMEASGLPLDLGPARQRSVLAVLLLAAGRPVPAPDLIMRVWGEDAPPAAEQALRSYLCRLRKIVDESAAVRIERRDGGYVAAVADGELDLAVLRRLGNRARTAVRDGQLRDALTDLNRALQLASGTPLTGVGSDWLDGQRAQLERERLAVALERNDLALATGAPDTVVADAVARLHDEPYDERVAGQAVLALAGVGRTAEALEIFEQVRRRLADDLGIDPSPALRDVQQRVLRGVQSAIAPPTAPAQQPRSPFAIPRQLPAATRGFVDRTVESQALDRLLPGGDDEPAVVVLSGPGGAGKTALAVHWARRRADRFPDGQLYVDLHGFDPDRRPITAESALRVLLGGLGVEQAAIPTELAEMVGTYRSLLADRRLLLVADDVATAGQVSAMLPPGPGSAMVVTSRSGLPGLVTTAGAHVLPVGLFDAAAGRQLLVERLGVLRTSTEPEAVDRLVVHCDGLPLALAILAGRAAALPTLSLTTLADELADESRRLGALCGTEARANLDAVVASSMATLTPTACSVLQWLAAGPAVSIRPSMLAAVAALAQAQADDVLRELLSIHLLEAAGPRSFRMHDLVRLVVRSRPVPGIDEAVDRLLSFMITEHTEGAISGHGDGATDVDDLLVALAYAAETGRDAALCDLATALESPLGSAGRWSELVLVNEQAASAADRLGDDHRRTSALIGRGRGRIGRREFGEAGEDLATALAVAERLGDLGLQARAHRALARLGAHQHRWDEALHHDRCGLVLHCRRGDVLGEAHAHNAIGWHLAHLGQAEAALASCRRGLAIFVEQDDRAGQALTLDSIGYALDLLGRTHEALDAYRQGADVCRELGRQVVLANTLLRLAAVAERLGDDHEAAAVRAEAEEILRLSGGQILEP